MNVYFFAYLDASTIQLELLQKLFTHQENRSYNGTASKTWLVSIDAFPTQPWSIKGLNYFKIDQPLNLRYL